MQYLRGEGGSCFLVAQVLSVSGKRESKIDVREKTLHRLLPLVLGYNGGLGCVFNKHNIL